MNDPEKMKQMPLWPARFGGAAIFFAAALLVLTLVRLAFFFAYRSADTPFSHFVPALITGARADARWLAMALVPAWTCVLLSLRREGFWKGAVWAGGIGFAVILTLDLVNFGFYGFYGTPISPVIFGLFQDDTKAIVTTLLKDWPLFRYAFCLAAGLWLPFAAARLASVCGVHQAGRKSIVFSAVMGTLLLAVTARGSLGKFPLRLQDFVVSENRFVNAAVPGGAAAFYEACKGQRALLLKGGAVQALKEMGFTGQEDSLSLLRSVRSETPAPAKTADSPHIVLAIMESMGRDSMESYRPGANDTLGALAEELKTAVFFRNGISVGNGTFVSLEGILFDSPLTPITQSRYGNRQFPFSQILRFKKNGYRTIFLTAGPESWRQIDTDFPRQGFDEIIGAAGLRNHYPQAEYGVWGVGDAWMFRAAQNLLQQADEKGEKLFLVLLSATNHPPHHVPDGTPIKTVSEQYLPDFIEKKKTAKIGISMLQTYQYAANALGNFVHDIRSRNFRRGTLIAATGDHNARYQYRPEGVWHHARGVPVMFWLPENMKPLAAAAQTDRWVSHRDIFPTLSALVLGTAPALHEGRNLFGQEPFDLALSFDGIGKKGFAVGSWGAAALDGGNSVSCYRWQKDHLVPEAVCSGDRAVMAGAARAQRALADYEVRKGLLGGQ